MTTAWAHLVRGEVVAALKANVGGTLLAILAVVAVPWLASCAARGEWVAMTPNGTVAACIATTILVVTLIDWLVRLLN